MTDRMPALYLGHGAPPLLDVASPAMREALLKAFLDRLSRPSR